MVRLFDGKNILTIGMYEDGGPDFSADFFEVGRLEYAEGLDAYRVPDAEYCEEMADAWRDKIGDFVDDADNMPDAVRDVDARTEPAPLYVAFVCGGPEDGATIGRFADEYAAIKAARAYDAAHADALEAVGAGVAIDGPRGAVEW